MTITKQIQTARSYKDNAGAYARVMSAAIRSAMSDRAAKAFRAAIIEDGMQHAFAGFDTNCPTAA